MQRELDWTRTHDIDSEDLMPELNRSNFFVLRSDLVQRLKGQDDPEYEQALLESLKRVGSPDNPALNLLLNFYASQERHCDLIRLSNKHYTDVENIPKELLRQVRISREKAGSNCTAQNAS